MKYKYRYNKDTREYQIERDDIKSALFKSLRDCKLSWKFLNTATWMVDGKTIHTFKETRNVKDKEESADNLQGYSSL